MTVATALREALRDVLGPYVRGRGLTGTAPTWRRASATGDWLVVNVQASAWGSATTGSCYLNLAILPALHWEWTRSQGTRSSAPLEQHGAWRARLSPTWEDPASPSWWELTDSSADARAAVDDMVRALEPALDLLVPLVDDADALLAAALRDDPLLPQGGPWRSAVAHLLAARGDYDAALAEADVDADPDDPFSQWLVAYCDARR